MENWLVISNCQTYGMANTLQSQISDVIVEGVDVLLFQSDPEKFIRRAEQSDKLFISREVRDMLIPLGLAAGKAWIELPMFTFRAYHPDLTYLIHNGGREARPRLGRVKRAKRNEGHVSAGKPLDGPTNHYHSAIAYACFKAGLSVSDTLQRFNGAFFERCGYMSLWTAERDRLIEEVAHTGVDIAASIRRWGRQDAFMYSINHPKIRVFQDISSELLKLQGRTPVAGIQPHDNLASGPWFAVYPEIAEDLGVSGAYVFKSVANYRPFGLEQFLHESFELYGGLDPQTIAPHQHIDHIVAQL